MNQFQFAGFSLEDNGTFIHISQELGNGSGRSISVTPVEFTEAMETLFNRGGEISPVSNPVEAQSNGEPIFELTAGMEIPQSTAAPAVPGSGDNGGLDNPVESNFAFYVDGYTVGSTDVVGEILVTAPDGQTKVIRSRVLTDFFARRFEPPVPSAPAS